MWGYVLTGLVGVTSGMYIYSKLFGTSKKQHVHLPTTGILYLVDGKLDHLFSVSDLISPTADAFDKPFEFCKYIDLVPKDQHIKLVICTKGGALSSLEKILKKLKKHPAGYTAYIKNECFSAGAMIALGAKEIVMNDDSYLGKVDVQIASMTESYSVIDYYNLDEKYITGDNIQKVKSCEQLINYTNDILTLIFGDNEQLKDNVRKQMIFSKYPHSKTFDYTDCQNMGLTVRRHTEDELNLFI